MIRLDFKSKFLASSSFLFLSVKRRVVLFTILTVCFLFQGERGEKGPQGSQGNAGASVSSGDR